MDKYVYLPELNHLVINLDQIVFMGIVEREYGEIMANYLTIRFITDEFFETLDVHIPEEHLLAVQKTIGIYLEG